MLVQLGSAPRGPEPHQLQRGCAHERCFTDQPKLNEAVYAAVLNESSCIKLTGLPACTFCSPGMTKNGKQKTPDWLAGLLGAQQEEEAPMSDADKKTLEQLLGGNYAD